MMDTQRLINFSSKLTSPTSKLVHTLTQSFRAWAQTYCTDQVLQTEVDNLVQSNSKIYDRRMRNNRDYLNQQSAILLKQFVANTLLPKYFNTVSNPINLEQRREIEFFAYQFIEHSFNRKAFFAIRNAMPSAH